MFNFWLWLSLWWLLSCIFSPIFDFFFLCKTVLWTVVCSIFSAWMSIFKSSATFCIPYFFFEINSVRVNINFKFQFIFISEDVLKLMTTHFTLFKGNDEVTRVYRIWSEVRTFIILSLWKVHLKLYFSTFRNKRRVEIKSAGSYW